MKEVLEKERRLALKRLETQRANVLASKDTLDYAIKHRLQALAITADAKMRRQMVEFAATEKVVADLNSAIEQADSAQVDAFKDGKKK